MDTGQKLAELNKYRGNNSQQYILCPYCNKIKMTWHYKGWLKICWDCIDELRLKGYIDKIGSQGQIQNIGVKAS